jgi:zinc transport system ATP-binding protein
MSTPIIRLQHVRAGSARKPILEDINLSLDAGHFMGIVGPNGAGKSTLLHIMAGLSEPDAGHVDLMGKCLRRHNRRRLLSSIGFLSQFQEAPGRLPVNAREVVAMGLGDYARPLWRSPGPMADVDQALEMMGVTSHADEDFRQLSGGQKQRVRIARALVASPKLLLLDEPSAALDASGQEKLYQRLRLLCEERGMTIVMVEHDVAAISSYVDSVACLNRRIHFHAGRGESIPDDVWKAMYGDHVHIMAHDAKCIGCTGENEA